MLQAARPSSLTLDAQGVENKVDHKQRDPKPYYFFALNPVPQQIVMIISTNHNLSSPASRLSLPCTLFPLDIENSFEPVRFSLKVQPRQGSKPCDLICIDVTNRCSNLLQLNHYGSYRMNSGVKESRSRLAVDADRGRIEGRGGHKTGSRAARREAGGGPDSVEGAKAEVINGV